MKSKDVFKVELSRIELFWLAKNLGFVQFPLLCPLDLAAPTEIDLQTASDHLQERGLVKFESGSGWQVEKILILITHLIANPDEIIWMHVSNRDGLSKQAFIYPSPQFPLLVEEGERLCFTLYNHLSDLLASKKEFWALPQKATLARKGFFIPHQLLSSLFNLPSTEKQDGELSKVVDLVECLGLQSILVSKDGELETVDCKGLIWSESHIWAGVIYGEIKQIEFKPFGAGQVLKWLATK